MRKKIPSLDGLRAVSIILVLLGHINGSYLFPAAASKYIRNLFSAELGVMIFFVISGFLITHLLLEEKAGNQGVLNIKNFYIRRALRIFPVCYLYLLFVFIASKYLASVSPVTPGLFLMGLTYTINFATGAPWVLGHLWSLGVEEQFYLFWPWVVRLQKNMITAIAVMIIFIAPVIRYCFRFDNSVLNSIAPFLMHADALMFGCLLAILKAERPDLWDSKILGNVYLRIFSILVCWSVYFLIAHQVKGFGISVLGVSLAQLLTTFLIAGFIEIQGDIFFKFLNQPIMIRIGVLSYSIYIWQQFFLYDKNLPLGTVWWRSFPLNIVLVFFTACISYFFWEKRFFALKDRFKTENTSIAK